MLKTSENWTMVGGKTPLQSSASASITENESNCGVSELDEKTEIL